MAVNTTVTTAAGGYPMRGTAAGTNTFTIIDAELTLTNSMEEPSPLPLTWAPL